jgi:hypothetical protein
VITDIDSKDADGNTAAPVRGAGHTSGNYTLRNWWPAISELDALLDKPEAEKEKPYDAERFKLRIAYQCPVEVEFKGTTTEALAYTLEDAIVVGNLDLFAALPGSGLIAKFRGAIADSADFAALSAAMKQALRSGNKAEFALDLLEIENPSDLKPPHFIREGLLWLGSQLERKKAELGLAQILAIDPAPDGAPAPEMSE